MRVLLLNTYDTGGAATATTRIAAALRSAGIEARVMVQVKRGDDPHVLGPDSTMARAYSEVRPLVDPIPLRLAGGSDGNFSLNWLPDRLGRRIDAYDPDIVHLNWVGGGFFTPRTLAGVDVPIVWRLPDMWAFTGGCHYSEGCDRYTGECGSCPKLGRSFPYDLSRLTWKRKARAWRDVDLTIVAPSTWLAERARESSLFGDRSIEVIPNALDTSVYRPVEAKVGRELFGLPSEKHLVLFGAPNATSDPRKGFDLLRDALRDLSDVVDGDDVALVVFGVSEPEEPPDLGFETHYVGYLHDEVSLVLLYGAADLMVVPSRYEGFGQTVTESLACGTPVVAYRATGPRDTVDHRSNGYLADPYESTDLASGIAWVLEDRDRRAELAENAREKAEREYSLAPVAERYCKVYETALGTQ